MESARDDTTGGRLFKVNGVPVFIRGGAWVAADALLRLSAQDYDDQVRLHAEANLNLIRVWGGSITERPAFYDACDRHGVLVWQEFWMTADCSDPSSGRNPEDAQLFLSCATDAIRMVRNHASLCLWVGGNELPASTTLGEQLRLLVQQEDGTRPYVSSSTNGAEGLGSGGQFGDGPYGILDPSAFFDGTWSEIPNPFTPETGSVGMPVAESIRAMMSQADAEDFPTDPTWPPNDAWYLHLYIPFSSDGSAHNQLHLYGTPATLEAFSEQAQAAQFQQYKAMFEGRNAHMWSQYTGGILWRSAPGWTVLRGQIYDQLREQTGGYWGIRLAGEPLHPQLDLSTLAVGVANNTRMPSTPCSLTATICAADGTVRQPMTRTVAVPSIAPSSYEQVISLSDLESDTFHLVVLRLTDASGSELAQNTDWLYNSPPVQQPGNAYSALRSMPAVTLEASGHGRREAGESVIDLQLSNPADVCAFAVRIQVLEPDTGQRVLPVFASDNYFALLPGSSRAGRVAVPNLAPRKASRRHRRLEHSPSRRADPMVVRAAHRFMNHGRHRRRHRDRPPHC